MLNGTAQTSKRVTFTRKKEVFKMNKKGFKNGRLLDAFLHHN